MFDILVGTLIPAKDAESMIKQVNPKGFESYELDFAGGLPENIEEYAKKINDAKESAKISALAAYGNTMCDPKIYERVELLIKKARLFDCDTVCIFAGADPKISVPDNMPLFKKTFDPLARLAEENGVKIGFENCGSGWKGNSYNIAFCS